MANRFTWQVTLLPIVFIVLTAGILSFLNIIELQQHKAQQIEQVTKDFLEQEKRMAKNRVMKASELISFQHNQTKELVRKRVKERVDEAIHIANALFERYHDTLPEETLKEQIKLLLSNAVFDHPDGYFFAVDMTTEKIIVHKLDKLVGYSMSNHKDLRGTPVLTEQKQLLSQNDGAFQTIYFSKPADPANEFPKQIYIRYFKPFNWLIGTGEYIDDMEQRLQELVLKRFKALNSESHEYLFVKKMHSLQGGNGEPYATLILSNNPIHKQNQQLFDTDLDSKGKYFRKEVLQVLNEHGEGFVSYWHPSPRQGQDVQKTSFFFYDKNWNWTIGSGFYYDSLEQQLAQIEKSITTQISKEIWSSLGITVTIIFMMSVIFYIISKQITKTINSYAAKLEQAQKMESIGRLAGGIAHDLNNLLSPIIGYSDFLLDEPRLGEEFKHDIRQINHAGEKSSNLVRQLLAFSRKQVLEYKRLNVNDVISGFEKLLRRTIREDIEINITMSPEIKLINADVGQIEQILMNLAVNASDAMQDGGTLSIETCNVTLDEGSMEGSRGDYVMLAVSDTGHGMDREICNNIFEPFYTTKKDKGTGLGLATVYGIVKQHDGNISVESKVDKGTIFKVFFPISIQQDIADEILLPESGNLKGTETILIVEDDDLVRNLAKQILDKNGYKVIALENGKQAIQHIQDTGHNVDVLLTDVIMPQMNGKELQHEITKILPGIKVIYMSGYTDDVIAHHGVLDKGVNFIHKPFTSQKVLSKVREVLNKE